MRLALQEGLFDAGGFAGFLEKAAGWGIGEVEVWGEGLGARLTEVNRALRAAGIRACSICPGGDGVRGSLLDDDWRDAAEDIVGYLRMGAELGGAGVILVPRFRRACFLRLYPDFEVFERNREIFVERLSPIAREAEKLGAPVLLEPLNRYEADFLLTVDQAAELCEAVGSPRVLALADLFHMNIEEENLPAALTRNAKRIGHVHLADSNRLAPGEGHTDFAAALRALSAAGYAGPLCIECFCGAAPERSIGGAMEYLRKCQS